MRFLINFILFKSDLHLSCADHFGLSLDDIYFIYERPGELCSGQNGGPLGLVNRDGMDNREVIEFDHAVGLVEDGL